MAGADAPETTVLLGGEAALSAAVEAAVPGPLRVAGPDRAATAAAIAVDLLGFTATGERRVVVFNPFQPRGWTRGLAIAGLAAAEDVPVLALADASVPPATADLVRSGSGEPEVDVLVAGPTGRSADAGGGPARGAGRRPAGTRPGSRGW